MLLGYPCLGDKIIRSRAFSTNSTCISYAIKNDKYIMKKNALVSPCLLLDQLVA